MACVVVFCLSSYGRGDGFMRRNVVVLFYHLGVMWCSSLQLSAP